MLYHWCVSGGCIAGCIDGCIAGCMAGCTDGCIGECIGVGGESKHSFVVTSQC